MYVYIYIYIYICPQKISDCRLWVLYCCLCAVLYNLSLYLVESFNYPIASKSISKETEALQLPLDFFHKPHTNRCDRVHQPSATKMFLIYTSTLAVITITTIFATLAISKGAKLLDYSSMLSTFGTLFLCLITN